MVEKWVTCKPYPDDCPLIHCTSQVNGDSVCLKTCLSESNKSKVIVSNSIHYDKHLSMENFLSANLSLTLFLPNITDSRIELIEGRSVAVLVAKYL